MIHELLLKGYEAVCSEAADGLRLGTAESYGIERLHLTAGAGWEGLTVTATFHPPGGQPVRVLADADGCVAVPPEATAGGVFGRVVFAGTADGLRRCTADLVYSVLPHAGVAGAASDPTPPLAEQILNQLQNLGRDVEDLKYIPIKITAFGCAPSTAEMGSTVDAVTLSWSVNKTPKTLMLDGETLDNSAVNICLTDLGLTGNKTWTLRAVDERATAVSATASLTFLNGVYYGAAAAPEDIDSAFVLGLTKTLTGGKVRSFTANAGAGQYIWYCLPSRFGSCKFTVGGFDGGFDRVAALEFTNASGYTENYDVYRSANAALGATTVGVS